MVTDLDGPDADSAHDLRRERDLLAQAQDLTKVGAWEWDVDSGVLQWTDEVFRIFGHEPREFPATYQAFIERIHPDDRSMVWQRTKAALDGGGEFDFRHRVMRPDGDVRNVHARGRVTQYDQGRAVTMIGTVMDVTDEALLQLERDAALKSLAESEERYRLLAENAWDVVWTMELDGSISYVSPSVERMRGITPAEAMVQAPEEIQPPSSVARTAEYFGRLFEAIATGGELPTYHGEMDYYRRDGSIMHGELDVVPQVDAEGNVVRILGVTRDVSERVRLEGELNRLAQTDPLTGVWNRRHAEQLIDEAVADARRADYPLAALMLDIDHFKRTNDQHGHRAGDDVLVEMIRRVSEHLGEADVLGRWGGEEFVVMASHATLADAVTLAEKLRAAVAETPFEGVGPVAVSIGVAELHSDDTLASWIHRADEAMYGAKRAGRNAVKSEG
ncbi:MAG: diguanylate cyclase [Candidatus Nanopelagicales bacterium]